MRENIEDLMQFLCANKSFKTSTIESLKEFGFDSNETLLALDLEKDLHLMSTISLGQRSLLRRLLSEFKQTHCPTASVFDEYSSRDCYESHRILNQIKNFIGINTNGYQDKQSVEELNSLKSLLTQKQSLIDKYVSDIENLKSNVSSYENEIFRLRKVIKTMENEFKNCLEDNKSQLKKVKDFLMKEKELSEETNKRPIRTKKITSRFIETDYQIKVSENAVKKAIISENRNSRPVKTEDMSSKISNNKCEISEINGKSLKTRKKSNKNENSKAKQTINISTVTQCLAQMIKNVDNTNIENSSESSSQDSNPNASEVSVDLMIESNDCLNSEITTSDVTNNNVIYDCSSVNKIVNSSHKRSIHTESKQNNCETKKLKTIKNSSPSHVLCISLDESQESLDQNQITFSTITGSSISSNLNPDDSGSVTKDYEKTKSSELLLTQKIETNDSVSHISTSNGYLSDSNEENKCPIDTIELFKGYKCNITGCEFTTLFKPKFDDHVHNHVNYHLGQEIPELWKPFFADYIKSK